MKDSLSNNRVSDFNKYILDKHYYERTKHVEWMECLEFARNAIVIPQTRYDASTILHPNTDNINLFNGGVYRRNGEIIEHSIHLQERYLINMPDTLLRDDCPMYHLSGCWLFGGLLKVDFGHFLTESLGRLWALQNYEARVQGIIFYRLNGIPSVIGQESFAPEVVRKCAREVSEFFPYIRELLNLLTNRMPIRVVEEATIVEDLLVPSQLMGLCEGDLLGGHPTYRDVLRAQLNRSTPINGVGRKKIYISRSKLSEKDSYFFIEDFLEEFLKDNGYDILFPETMNITEQINEYMYASHIILSTGSAAHALAMTANPGQSVYLIHRHPGAWPGFGKQLRLMGVGILAEADYVNGAFVPVETKHRDKLHPARTIHSLDFEALWQDLHDQGFVTKSQISKVRQDVIDSRKVTILERLHTAYGFKFEYVKI